MMCHSDDTLIRKLCEAVAAYQDVSGHQALHIHFGPYAYRYPSQGLLAFRVERGNQGFFPLVVFEAATPMKLLELVREATEKFDKRKRLEEELRRARENLDVAEYAYHAIVAEIESEP